MKMMTTALSLLLVIALSATAFAADLRNNDRKAYKFKLVDGNLTSSKSIRANSAIYGLCTPNSQCKIILAGRTSQVFNSNSTMKIEGGVVKPQ